MAKELESGRYLLSDEEVEANAGAAQFLEKRMGTRVRLTEPLTRDEWLLVLAARQLADGRPEALDRVIEELESQLSVRRRPN